MISFAVKFCVLVFLFPKWLSVYANHSEQVKVAIILCCQEWIITESESVNLNFQIYRHNGPRPCPFLYAKYYRTL